MKRIVPNSLTFAIALLLFGVSWPQQAASTGMRQEGDGGAPMLLSMPGLADPLLVWSSYDTQDFLEWGTLNAAGRLEQTGRRNDLLPFRNMARPFNFNLESIYPISTTDVAALYIAGNQGLRALVFAAGTGSTPQLIEDHVLDEPVQDYWKGYEHNVVNWIDPVTDTTRFLAINAMARMNHDYQLVTATHSLVNEKDGLVQYQFDNVTFGEVLASYARDGYPWRWAGLAPGPLALKFSDGTSGCDGFLVLWADGMKCEPFAQIGLVNELLWDGEAAAMFRDGSLHRYPLGTSAPANPGEVKLEEPEGVYRHFARCVDQICAYFDAGYGHVHWVNWMTLEATFTDIRLPRGMEIKESIPFSNSIASNLWISSDQKVGQIVVTLLENEELDSDESLRGCLTWGGDTMVMTYGLYASPRISLAAPPATLSLTRIRAVGTAPSP